MKAKDDPALFQGRNEHRDPRRDRDVLLMVLGVVADLALAAILVIGAYYLGEYLAAVHRNWGALW